MADTKCTFELTEDQFNFICEAIECYRFTTASVMSYDETQEQTKLVLSIYNQAPDEWF